jgi:preprotein translocase subunit SecA
MQEQHASQGLHDELVAAQLAAESAQRHGGAVPQRISPEQAAVLQKRAERMRSKAAQAVEAYANRKAVAAVATPAAVELPDELADDEDAAAIAATLAAQEDAAGPAKVETVRRERPKIGRNDPCWCGSGQKYKKCHMEQDERI